MSSFFPSANIDPQRQADIREQMITVFEAAAKPRIAWIRFIIPAAASLALVAVIFIKLSPHQLFPTHQSGVSLAPGSSTSPQPQQSAVTSALVPSLDTATFDSLDQQLSDLSTSLDSDSDINSAINFTNL